MTTFAQLIDAARTGTFSGSTAGGAASAASTGASGSTGG